MLPRVPWGIRGAPASALEGALSVDAPTRSALGSTCCSSPIPQSTLGSGAQLGTPQFPRAPSGGLPRALSGISQIAPLCMADTIASLGFIVTGSYEKQSGANALGVARRGAAL